MAGDKRTIFDIEPGFERKHVWLLVGSLVVLYLVIRVVIPTDLYTTALWLDSFERPTPWTQQLNGPIFGTLMSLIPVTVSVEGMTFSVLLSTMQMMATYKMFLSGSWIKSKEEMSFLPATAHVLRLILGKRTEFRRDDINGRKYAWLFFWIFLVCFDAFTSYNYRISSPNDAGLPVTTGGEKTIVFLTYAVLYENVFSEILLGESLRASLTMIAILLMSIPAFRELWGSWQEKWEKSKRRKPNQSNQPSVPERRPVPAQPQERRPDRQESNPDRPLTNLPNRPGESRRPRPARPNGGDMQDILAAMGMPEGD